MVNTDIAILGGGLNGAALALALSRGPHAVTLVEPYPPAAPSEDWDARIYAYSPGNVAWLRQLGGWDDALIRAQAVHAMRVQGDAPAQSGALNLDALDAGLAELAVIAEQSRLQTSIWNALRDAGVTLIHTRPQSVVWGADGRHVLHFAEGRSVGTQLLVGADGAHSWLRAQAGIAVDIEDYRHSGIVSNFECEKPHRGIAWQWFRTDGVLAYLPLPGRRISIVWSAPSDRVDWHLHHPDFAAEVADAGEYTLGQLRLITPPQAFPLKRRRAREWVRPGLALIGDAAHTVHPLAGQGVNLGFRDSRLLAEMLAHGGHPGEMGRLRAYALRRVEDVTSMQNVCGGLKKLFYDVGPGFGWSDLRNGGMRCVEGLDFIKQALMRHAIQ